MDVPGHRANLDFFLLKHTLVLIHPNIGQASLGPPLSPWLMTIPDGVFEVSSTPSGSHTTTTSTSSNAITTKLESESNMKLVAGVPQAASSNPKPQPPPTTHILSSLLLQGCQKPLSFATKSQPIYSQQVWPLKLFSC